MNDDEQVKFEFNTGRLYTADGQLIKCTLLWSNAMCTKVIFFNDTTRGLSGWLPYTGQEKREAMCAAVMAAYDNHAYCHASVIERVPV